MDRDASAASVAIHYSMSPVPSSFSNHGPGIGEHTIAAVRNNFSNILRQSRMSQNGPCSGGNASMPSTPLLQSPSLVTSFTTTSLAPPLTSMPPAGSQTCGSAAQFGAQRQLKHTDTMSSRAFEPFPVVESTASLYSPDKHGFVPRLDYNGICETNSSQATSSGHVDEIVGLPLQHTSLEQPQYDSYDTFKAEAKTDMLRVQHSAWNHFPTYFTIFWGLAFMVPVCGTIHLVYDTTVTYWFGSWCRVVILLPLVMIYGYFSHVRNDGRPYKPAIIVCMLLPSITLFFLNNTVMKASADEAQILRSVKCGASSKKRELQRSWKEASVLYDKCLRDTVRDATDRQLTIDGAQLMYRIDDCDEYMSTYSKNKRDWDYLKHLEMEHNCAGWCSFDKPLWTFDDVLDSCSVAAAQVFEDKITRLTSQTVMYIVTLIILSMVILFFAGPFMRSRGLDW
eukprot:TRINITY_DN52647_c0_g1_i1.p1 TRINITY_DN52647_c0_g1~~TRINITY_DN52647_c0_g1_i1.p1  ORF type:complete len:452 (+),score=48.28 TRINITY_DN52647_c0_g1_i1:144-1499(+)